MKKELLKKAMELSQMCMSNVLVVVYDEKKHKMSYYSSEDEFSLMSAH